MRHIQVIIWSLLCLQIVQAQQTDSDINDFQWLKIMTDSIMATTQLCDTCQIPPQVRSYYTPQGKHRFVLFYQCDNISSTTKHFETDGTLAAVCIKDSTNRVCEDIDVLEAFTLGNRISTIWSCDLGFDCFNTPKSLLFPLYEIKVNANLCFATEAILSVSHSFNAYEWILPDGNSVEDNQINANQTGTYELIVINDEGCTDTSFIDLDNTVTKTPIIIGEINICDQEGTTLWLEGYSSYLWSTGDTTSTITVFEEGEISVEVSNLEGCRSTVSKDIEDRTDESISIIPSSIEVYSGQTIDLFLESSGLVADTITNIQWSINDQIFVDGRRISIPINSPTHIIASAISSSGCFLEDQTFIEPLAVNRNIYIPNVFYPYSQNGNGRFLIQSIENTIKINKLSIYSRWGTHVFFVESPNVNNISSSWDGRKDGQLMPPGAYAYHLEVEYANRETEIITGTVTLIY